MKTPVNPKLFLILPVHDSEFISIQVVTCPNTDLKLHLVFKLHPNESLDEVAKLGITSRSLCLTYEKCWQIASNILGTSSTKETISDWSIVEESELLKGLRSHGVAKGVALVHHRFELSGGSSLDVLAEETVSIEEFVPPT